MVVSMAAGMNPASRVMNNIRGFFNPCPNANDLNRRVSDIACFGAIASLFLNDPPFRLDQETEMTVFRRIASWADFAALFGPFTALFHNLSIPFTNSLVIGGAVDERRMAGTVHVGFKRRRQANGDLMIKTYFHFL